MLDDNGLTGAHVSGGSFYDEEEPQEQPRSQFYGYTRGICRFGILAGGSLVVTLLFRQFEAITPIGWITLGCAIAGAVLTITFTNNDQLRFNVLLVTVVGLFGVLCGTWDAIRFVFATTPFAGQLLTVALVFVAAIAIDLMRRKKPDGSF